MKTAGRVGGQQDGSGKSEQMGGRRQSWKIRQKGEFDVLMALRLESKKIRHWPSPVLPSSEKKTVH